MENKVAKQEPKVPGIGVSGLVMCPILKSPCLKSGCEWWVELNYGDTLVSRCSAAWLSLLNTEIRQSIDRLKEKFDKPFTSN